MEQLNAQALLEHFAVYGRFYEKRIAGVPEQLRDRLEIAPRALGLEEIVTREPDLLVVMMNPGGSRPLGACRALGIDSEKEPQQGQFLPDLQTHSPAMGQKIGEKWTAAALLQPMLPKSDRLLGTLWDADTGQGFTAAVPDRTQYQIMRLLLAAQAKGLGWQHARILNLSDLRTPKSAEFVEKLQRYADHPEHSLFCDARHAECTALFANPSTPALLGWGLNPVFGAWADRALRAAQGHVRLGISADGRLFRHPLPQRQDMQLAWLADVVAQLPEP